MKRVSETKPLQIETWPMESVARWQGLTGKKATLEDDGRTFEAVAQLGLRMAA